MESLNQNIPSKRFLAEIESIKENKKEFFDIVQDPNNQFLLYFLLKGLEGDFKNGIYLGTILLDSNYPFRPPSIKILTPNGRFAPDCSIYFLELTLQNWSSMFTINNLLMALLSSMFDNDNGIGIINQSKEKRILMANMSVEYNKTNYPDIMKLFDLN